MSKNNKNKNKNTLVFVSIFHIFSKQKIFYFLPRRGKKCNLETTKIREELFRRSYYVTVVAPEYVASASAAAATHGFSCAANVFRRFEEEKNSRRRSSPSEHQHRFDATRRGGKRKLTEHGVAVVGGVCCGRT